jgi:hypothetical protein
MITRDDIKREVDKLPDYMLDEVYSMFKKFIIQNPSTSMKSKAWKDNLDNFPPDFLEVREQSIDYPREPLE